MPGERRELRDAVGERRPVRRRVAGERKAEQALGDVVPDDPQQRRRAFITSTHASRDDRRDAGTSRGRGAAQRRAVGTW